MCGEAENCPKHDQATALTMTVMVQGSVSLFHVHFRPHRVQAAEAGTEQLMLTQSGDEIRVSSLSVQSKLLSLTFAGWTSELFFLLPTYVTHMVTS